MSKNGLKLVVVVCVGVLSFMWSGISSSAPARDIKRTAADLKAAQAQMAAKIKQALTAKEWTVYVVKTVAAQGRPAVVEADTVTFTERTVVFKNLAAAGYTKTGSNYALRVGNDGSSVWETMQMHENKKDVVFLRGELPKGCGYMTGAIIYRLPKDEERTETFSTSMPASPAPAVVTTTVVTTGITQETPAVVTTTSTRATERTTRATTSR